MNDIERDLNFISNYPVKRVIRYQIKEVLLYFKLDQNLFLFYKIIMI
jgi:hypothetical protein